MYMYVQEHQYVKWNIGIMFNNVYCNIYMLNSAEKQKQNNEPKNDFIISNKNFKNSKQQNINYAQRIHHKMDWKQLCFLYTRSSN